MGACHDGSQTCIKTGTGEFGLQYGACTAFAIPTTCAMGVDAMCSGKVGCADPQCASALKCATDAGTASPPADAGSSCNPATCPTMTGVFGARKPCCVPDAGVCGGIGLTGECELS